jgi:DNA-directed RNA polymerase subunit omega
LLIKYDTNVYELTCAAIRRAYQVTITGDEEVEANHGKVVPTAIKQILEGKVIFKLEE